MMNMTCACRTSAIFNSYRTRRLRRRILMSFDIKSIIWRSTSAEPEEGAMAAEEDGLVEGDNVPGRLRDSSAFI